MGQLSIHVRPIDLSQSFTGIVDPSGSDGFIDVTRDVMGKPSKLSEGISPNAYDAGNYKISSFKFKLHNINNRYSVNGPIFTAAKGSTRGRSLVRAIWQESPGNENLLGFAVLGDSVVDNPVVVFEGIINDENTLEDSGSQLLEISVVSKLHAFSNMDPVPIPASYRDVTGRITTGDLKTYIDDILSSISSDNVTSQFALPDRTFRPNLRMRYGGLYTGDLAEGSNLSDNVREALRAYGLSMHEDFSAGAAFLGIPLDVPIAVPQWQILMSPRISQLFSLNYQRMLADGFDIIDFFPIRDSDPTEQARKYAELLGFEGALEQAEVILGKIIFLFGPNASRPENILSIKKLSDGTGRIINSINFSSNSGNAPTEDGPSIEKYGYRYHEVTTSLVPVPSQNAVLQSLLDEYSSPAREMEITIPLKHEFIYAGTLSTVIIEGTFRAGGDSGPIILEVDRNTGWKILTREIDFTSETIKLYVREIINVSEGQ